MFEAELNHIEQKDIEDTITKNLLYSQTCEMSDKDYHREIQECRTELKSKEFQNEHYKREVYRLKGELKEMEESKEKTAALNLLLDT